MEEDRMSRDCDKRDLVSVSSLSPTAQEDREREAHKRLFL